MRPLRVAQVLTNLHDGGIEKVVHQIATGLPRDRFEVRVFALIDRNPWLGRFRDDGIEVTVLGAKNRLAPATLTTNLGAVFRLSRELRSWECDVVNVHDFFPGVLGRVAAHLARVPRVIATLHNTYSWFGPGPHLVNRILGLGTDKVVAVSEAALKASRASDRLPFGKYLLLKNGVDPAPLQRDCEVGRAVRAELGIRAGSIVVGNVGTHSVRKDQKTLLQAVRSLATERELEVVIVGSPRGHEQEVENELLEIADSPELRGRVHFLRDRHDMHRIYNAFDIFCMTSVDEGLSLASIEAMMVGQIVVFSDIGPFRELVVDEKNGFLFETGNPVRLAEVLAKTIDLPSDVRTGIQDRARNSVLESFGLDATLRKYADLYEGR